MMALGGILGMTGATGAAATGAAAAGTAAAATTAATATTGFSISSILQGLTTVGGIVASLASANAEAQKYEMMAQDAEAEKGFETVQSVDRKRSLLRSAQEAVSSSDVAYAASGVDLSFGTAKQARVNAYRDADLGLNTDTNTTSSRISRLGLRAENYRIMGKNAKMMGWLDAGMKGIGLFGSLSQQV